MLEGSLHKLIKKVGEDIETLKFNTAIAAMMAFLNEITEAGHIGREELKTFLVLANPFAPHITEEIWQRCNFSGMVFQQKWPEFDPQKCLDESIEIAVQVSGKLRGRVVIMQGCEKDVALLAAKSVPEVARAMQDKTIVKEILFPINWLILLSDDPLNHRSLPCERLDMPFRVLYNTLVILLGYTPAVGVGREQNVRSSC